MRRSDLTLMQQMKITAREIERRKKLLDLTEADAEILNGLKPVIITYVDDICEEFYNRLLNFDEMDQVIGDSETLTRLKAYQRQYILGLFDGQYDDEYIHSRLRVGLVHKRIGVEPKYYISAVYHLGRILKDTIIRASKKDCEVCGSGMTSLDKILTFDLILIVDTYIDSLIEESRRAEAKLEEYTRSLEETVAMRTRKLKEMARHDGLTGLLNQAAFYRELRRELSRAGRLNYPVTLLYFDLDNFKQLNDNHGHKAGDQILVDVAGAIQEESRQNEMAARYGGDEFCVILGQSSLRQGEAAAKRLSRTIEKAVKGSGVSCSMGLACSTPEKMLDADTLVKEADKAMYAAKEIKGFSIHLRQSDETD